MLNLKQQQRQQFFPNDETMYFKQLLIILEDILLTKGNSKNDLFTFSR